MTSLQTSVKQNLNDVGYYIPLASLLGKVYGYTPSSAQFSVASWAYYGPGASLSSINGAGTGILKDMGKTVVSSLRTFRKVQLLLNGTGAGANTSVSTFGVGGRAATSSEDYLTGYIELGFEGNGTPAPVAHFGR